MRIVQNKKYTDAIPTLCPLDPIGGFGNLAAVGYRALWGPRTFEGRQSMCMYNHPARHNSLRLIGEGEEYHEPSHVDQNDRGYDRGTTRYDQWTTWIDVDPTEALSTDA